MKRKIAIGYFLVSLLLLTGCYAGEDQAKIELELIVKGTETEFWRYVENGAKAGKQLANVNLRVSGPALEKDYKKQHDYMMEAIKRAPDAILLAAGDYQLMEEAVASADAEGIPVFIVDSSVAGDHWQSFIGTDNHALGARLGTETISRLTNQGEIGVISFVEKAHPSLLREEGLREAFQQAGIDLLETVYCDSNIDLAEAQTYAMLEENPNLVGIVGLNAQAATGAARALKKMKRSDIFLGGIDCTVEEAGYIETGYLDVVILQNPYLMGFFGVRATLDYLNGQTVEKEILVDSQVVDRENLHEEKNQQLIFPFE